MLGKSGDDDEGYGETKASEHKGGLGDIRNHAAPPEFVKFMLHGAGAADAKNNHHDAMQMRCEKFYEAIAPKITGRLNKVAVVDYLVSLTKIQVEQQECFCSYSLFCRCPRLMVHSIRACPSRSLARW